MLQMNCDFDESDVIVSIENVGWLLEFDLAAGSICHLGIFVSELFL